MDKISSTIILGSLRIRADVNCEVCVFVSDEVSCKSVERKRVFIGYFG